MSVALPVLPKARSLGVHGCFNDMSTQMVWPVVFPQDHAYPNLIVLWVWFCFVFYGLHHIFLVQSWLGANCSVLSVGQALICELCYRDAGRQYCRRAACYSQLINYQWSRPLVMQWDSGVPSHPPAAISAHCAQWPCLLLVHHHHVAAILLPCRWMSVFKKTEGKQISCKHPHFNSLLISSGLLCAYQGM